MERTGAVLASLIKKLGIEQGVRLSQIRSSWDTVFAEPLPQHMWPASLTEGELLLQVDSPIWMQQLTFLKQDIVRKLSRFGVRDVRFRLGKIYRQDRPVIAAHPSRGLSPEEISFIQGLVTDIRDEEIKNAVKKAAEKSLTSSGRKGRNRARS